MIAIAVLVRLCERAEEVVSAEFEVPQRPVRL
jgi:hypothetical protein